MEIERLQIVDTTLVECRDRGRTLLMLDGIKYEVHGGDTTKTIQWHPPTEVRIKTIQDSPDTYLITNLGNSETAFAIKK
ncbi:hypothetical protein ACFLQJ_02750 [Calditrichota bacterium]